MLQKLLKHGLPFVNVGNLLRLRAASPLSRNRVLMLFEGRSYTYGESYDQSLRYANWFSDVRQQAVREGRLAPGVPLAVGILLENTPEFVFAYFGAALSGSVLFCINTGFRGQTLKTVIEQAELQLLISEARFEDEVVGVVPDLESFDAQQAFLIDSARELPLVERALEPYSVDLSRPVEPIENTAPFVVIYTSGTTGAPKGVPCSQVKLLGIGLAIWHRLRLRRGDRGYICMPLFHSNAWFLGAMPLICAGGSFVVTRRFSASAFESDVLEHGITFMNYVGQPIHYILKALESKYGSGDEVVAALAKHPQNRLRIAHGNGATPIDRQKLTRYMGMDHIYELYGATEAIINSYVRPGDPIDSVGRVDSKSVVILNEQDQICEPGVVDEQGRLTNYAAAVGEISRKIDSNNILFQGYHKNVSASSKKYRDGYFRSGDLGHIRIVNNKRYLYFNGRTDDWIRKDGENFSAENVSQFASRLPDVELAVAYGAPAPVADELVMVALKLRDGASFEPQGAFDRFIEQQKSAGMDAKWMPDFIRIVEEFETTQTGKILIRALKKRHFRLDNPADRIYFRRRGDSCYRELDAEQYQTIHGEFAQNGRADLLDIG